MPDKQYEDFLFSFERGVNSGVEAVLLLKNQLAWAENATVRGGYITHRPPIKRQTLNYQGNTPQDQAALQALVEGGKFQGAGVYRPDVGVSQIVAAISGRLFAYIPVGSTWNVSEITINNTNVVTGVSTVELNDVGAEQVWMTQAEKWLVISDGVNLPAFYDGVTCRRSYGAAQLIATISTTNPLTPPAIGGIVTADLTAPYAGPVNMPVLFNHEFYEINGVASGYPMRLYSEASCTFVGNIPVGAGIYSTLNTAGTTAGTVVFGGQTWSGVTTAGRWFHCGALAQILTGFKPVATWEMATTPYSIPAGTTFTLAFAGNVPAIPAGTQFSVPISFARNLISVTGYALGIDYGYYTGSLVCELVSVAGLNATFRTTAAFSQTDVLPSGCKEMWPIFVPSGSNIAAIGVGQHDLLVTTSAAIPITGPSTYFNIFVQSLYSADAGGIACAVYMNGAYEEGFRLYPPVVAGGATVYLKNLSDTATAAYTETKIYSVPELPACKMMAYDMSRLWMVLQSGIDFVGGDIVGDASGTPANDYRDAVLKMVGNDFQEGGGKFRVPSSGNLITALTFTPVLDTSFGLGPLQVSTQRSMYSCSTPVDRTTWAALTNPILAPSLKGDGPISHHATILANSDIIFRSAQNLNTFIMGRRSFDSWGNTGVGQEMRRLFNADDRSLLGYASAVNHNNRYLVTASPRFTDRGVVHSQIAALNFDMISGMTAKAEPVYDGAWALGDVFRLFSGEFGTITRAFAFMLDASGAIALHELLLDGAQGFDHTDLAIPWAMESAMVFNKDVKSPEEIVNLLNGEIYVKDVHGAVGFTVLYRPDFHPTWIPWTQFSISADATSLTGYRTPLGFGKPTIDGTAENANNRSYPNGHFFQVRVEIIGDCKVTALRFAASQIPKTPFSPPVANTANPVQLITSAGQDLPMP